MEITAKRFQQGFPALAAQFRSPADIELLARHCSLLRVPAGTPIIVCGGTVSTFYLVWRGLLAASIEEGAARLALGAIGPGQWVGEVSLIDPGPTNTSVTSIEDSDLLALSHEKFNALRISHPPVAAALLRALCLNINERLRPAGERVIEQVGNHEFQYMVARQLAHDMRALNRALFDLLFGRGSSAPQVTQAPPGEPAESRARA